MTATRRDGLSLVLARLAPAIPRFEHEAVLDHACASKGLAKASAEAAVWLSLVAVARHLLTDYDRLLADGQDQDSARWFVVDDINRVLASWGCPKRVSGNPDLPDGAAHYPKIT